MQGEVQCVFWTQSITVIRTVPCMGFNDVHAHTVKFVRGASMAEAKLATTVEVCAETLRSCAAAVEGGAHRIELCSALSEGGLTPSLAFIRAAVQLAAGTSTQVGVLIRPRAGDFVYSAEEVAIMEADIGLAVDAGAAFIVSGALAADGCLDEASLRRLIAACGPNVPFVCHRCVDVSVDPLTAFYNALQLGAARVLTSGAAASALEGHGTLQAMLAGAQGDATKLCAAGGITAATVGDLLYRVPGLQQVHGSVRVSGPSGCQHQPDPPVYMAAERHNTPQSEHSRKDSTFESVTAFVAAAQCAELKGSHSP